MIELRLTNRQAFELHDMLRFLGQFGKMERGSGLDEVRLKLKAMENEIVCPRCGEKPIRRKGHCASCAMEIRREKQVS